MQTKKDPNSLDVIHITGTKGKGTTAAYTAVFIEEHFRRLRRPIKVGLYTSPHLITERERIRINSQSVDEEIFTAAFFSLWEKLCENTHENQKPGYLQLLALLSFHMFKQANVDVAIYEVHAGGRKDATNIFDTPVACGITTIGLDHVDLLGKTIQDIASHKSGILKPNSPGFSLHQSPEAKSVLVLQADELPCPLTFIEANPLLDTINHMPLAQRQNISLAIELANAYLGRYNVALSTQDIHNGMELCKWPGRFHKVEQHDITWYLDCAHNTISMPVVLSWFALQSGGIKHDTKRILIFGHESNRDTGDLVEIIAEFCETNSCHFDTIILSPYSRYGKSLPPPMKFHLEKQVLTTKVIIRSRNSHIDSYRAALAALEGNPASTRSTSSVVAPISAGNGQSL